MSNSKVISNEYLRVRERIYQGHNADDEIQSFEDFYRGAKTMSSIQGVDIDLLDNEYNNCLQLLEELR